MAIKISCDVCDADLTTSQCDDWKLTLTVDKIPFGNGQTFDIYVEPPIKPGTYVFCGMQCLTEFVKVINDA